MIVLQNQRALNVFDVVIITLVPNFGIRSLSIAAGIGPSSLIFWLIGALFFLFPLAIICAQLSRAYPQEGGLYAWTLNVLGEQSGFVVAWLYWLANIFYYPAVLIFLATNIAYFLGKPELALSKTYITLTVLLVFWVIVLISLLGVKRNKYILDFCGIAGIIIPILVLIGFGFSTYFIFGTVATTFVWHNFIPDNHIVHNLSSLTMIMFAMAGIEVSTTFANSVKNAKHNLYLGLLVGCGIMFILYVLGTFSMNILAAPSTIQKTSGLMHVFTIISQTYHLTYLTRMIIFLLVFSQIAAIIVWLLAPIIMFFKCTPQGILPKWLHKSDKNGTPVNALLFQGILVSLIIVLTNFLSSVNDMYQVLLLVTTVIAFIPYLFLVVVYLKARIRVNRIFSYVVGYSLFLSLLLAIIVSYIPTPELKTTHAIMIYESELIIGPVFFIILGWLLYKLKRDH